jgi:hypothetical protein
MPLAKSYHTFIAELHDSSNHAANSKPSLNANTINSTQNNNSKLYTFCSN